MGTLTGISGFYAGNVFTLRDGEELILGRSAGEADVVFGDSDHTISRKHCSVCYDGKNDQYIVTDHSTTGTYSSGDIRFPLEQKVRVAPGTLIIFGKNKTEILRAG